MSEHFWRRCSSCKTQIGFGVPYWRCSVTTCNRRGTDFVSCSVYCGEVHVPTWRHRDAWAEEKRAPASSQASPTAATSDTSDTSSHAATRRRSVVTTASPTTAGSSRAQAPRDILIVASKLKAYIRARSGMNTSESVLAELSERVRDLCDNAIGRAKDDGRKTIMDRDF